MKDLQQRPPPNQIRLHLIFATIWMLGGALSSCVSPTSVSVATPSPIKEDFNLHSPPPGWVRWQDDIHRVAVWHPGDWSHWELLPGDDDVGPLKLYPPDQDRAGIWLNTVKPVDFVADPRDPVIAEMDGGNYYPESTYRVTVDGLNIPCARYTGGFRLIPLSQINHVCVMPGLPNRQQPYDYVLKMWVEQQWESDIIPTWRMIVMSFALEQRPPPSSAPGK